MGCHFLLWISIDYVSIYSQSQYFPPMGFITMICYGCWCDYLLYGFTTPLGFMRAGILIFCSVLHSSAYHCIWHKIVGENYSEVTIEDLIFYSNRQEQNP